VLDEVCHDFHRQYSQVASTGPSIRDSQSFSHSKVYNIYFQQSNFINRKEKAHYRCLVSAATSPT
jgi:hypothetical protein